MPKYFAEINSFIFSSDDSGIMVIFIRKPKFPKNNLFKD